MKLATRILSAFMALALCAISARAVSMEKAFPPVKEYPGYTDVPAGIWFEPNARLCYETGLLIGSTVGFEPERNMTVGEVAALAARIHQILNGGNGTLPSSEPWYQSALDYLGLLGITSLETPELAATRGQFVGLLSLVLPDALLSPINTIASLPDTQDVSVLCFYNAGILTGTDRYGTFSAANPLSRSEGAAMVSRVVRETLRKDFIPADYTPFTAAQTSPNTPFFINNEKTVTAEAYLSAVLSRIQSLELACQTQGIEFNWFHTVTASGAAFLDDVKDYALQTLGVEKGMGTSSYQNFDLQVFYSRYLDLPSALG